MARARPVKGGLVDLLDRALDKGVILQADVVITLSGVPLVALNLRAALASVETMLRWGLMRDWLETPGPRPPAPRSERGEQTWTACERSSTAPLTS